ncbi:MAG: DUF6178 family protein [Syntrophobacteraceae bacterium]|jgi:hypothetical protein|nr:DUF6178 family protein [Syntrophobacteraceae bacterium]
MSDWNDEKAAGIRVSEEECLEDLTPSEVSRRLMAMPARRRLELLLGRTDAGMIVSGMADQDFFLTVKEVGPEDALPLLALGTMEQLSHLFDIEWWKKDAVRPAAALEWLELLGRAGEGRLLYWLHQVDFELLTLLFKKWIHVVMLPEDMDLVEAREHLPAHTIDDQFFWECRYPQYENLVHHLLGLLFETHPGFYLELMNHILWLPDVECEESAYRFHRGRLEDRGVPDFYDALAIYRSPRPQEPKRRSSGEIPPFEGDAPSFALAVTREGDLLRRCMETAGDSRLPDMLRFELACLANKVLVADELPPDQAESLLRAADKAVAYVNLGLMERSGDRDAVAASLLKKVYLEDLFRLGHEMVSKVSRRVRGLVTSGWLSRWPYGAHCLDPDWLEWVELILERTPRVRRVGEGNARENREDLFRTPRDLSAADQQILVLNAMGRLFDALWKQGTSPNWSLWADGVVSRMEDVTLATMIWTAAAQRLHGGEWRLQPLRASEWELIWRDLHPAAMERVIEDWARKVLREEDQMALADLYVGPIHREYAQQMGVFAQESGAAPDPRLMKFFLFMEG